MATLTTASTLNNQINTYFSRKALVMLTPACLVYQFAEKTPLPKGNGTSVRFNGWKQLAAVTGALSEGGPGAAGASLSSRKVNGVVKQYGKFVSVTDYVDYAGVFSAVEDSMEVIVDCAKRSLDNVVLQAVLKADMARNTNALIMSSWSAATKSAYHAGSQGAFSAKAWGFPVRWGSSAARVSLFQVKSASACMGQVAITSCVRSLRAQNAMEFADGNFVMLSNTSAASDLINDPDFKAWHQSVDNSPIKTGLPQGMKPVAKAFGVSVFTTNNMPKSTLTGSLCDISFIFGRGAYGCTEFNTNGKTGFQIIIKKPGDQSTDNPLDLFSTIGFKFQCCGVALNVSAGRLLITLPR